MSALNPSQKVNWWQTPQQRQEKYWLARSLGVNASWARRMRDWPLRKIERRFNLVPLSLQLCADGRISQQNSA